jgi:hypothetical protein
MFPIAGARPERDYTSSRLARRARMSAFEDLSRRFSCGTNSRKVPLAKAVGIDQVATRRIFYRYRDGWHAGSASSGIHDGSRHRRWVFRYRMSSNFSRPQQQKTTNAGQQKMAEWCGA